MEKIVRKDVISIISEALDAIDSGNFGLLNKISNHTVHNASIYQDEYSITIAVVIHALSQLGKRDYLNSKFVGLLKDAKEMLERKKDEQYREIIQEIIDEIRALDSKMRLYIQEVINRAQIKKGSKLFSQGISLQRAAELLGVSQWEVMQYVGKTNLLDDEWIQADLQKRIEFTREVFGL